ncbi:hypothetical protein PGN35_002595 [Nodosilinea sp. PGN35]|nr:hypothetical protein [Nodosilinea sp. TSF1-S3]MDF0365508.1 hypothetical protein [Nodosilinea sp. TSF1-S3]
MLAIVVGGVGGWGYGALSPQLTAAPLSPGVESPSASAPGADAEAVASTYIQSQKRSGSGRRRMRGS